MNINIKIITRICNIINAYSVTLDQFNASLQNKSIILLTPNSTVFP